MSTGERSVLFRLLVHPYDQTHGTASPLTQASGRSRFYRLLGSSCSNKVKRVQSKRKDDGMQGRSVIGDASSVLT